MSKIDDASINQSKIDNYLRFGERVSAALQGRPGAGKRRVPRKDIARAMDVNEHTLNSWWKQEDPPVRTAPALKLANEYGVGAVELMHPDTAERMSLRTVYGSREEILRRIAEYEQETGESLGLAATDSEQPAVPAMIDSLNRAVGELKRTLGATPAKDDAPLNVPGCVGKLEMYVSKLRELVT